jgi:hypothetical protein
MAKAKTEVVVAKSNLPVSIAEQLRKETEELSKRIAAPGGDKIKLTKDKFFKLPDGTKNAGPLTVVILDFVSTNLFHDSPYKEGAPSAPACFAIGLEPDALAPSKTSPDVQSASCNVCPNNKFGSKGTGKACKNIRKLAVIAGAGALALDPNSPMWMLEVSPTGLKAFDAYVQTVRAQFGVPPVGVITDVFFDPSSDHQSLRFGNPQPNPNLEAHFSRRTAARQRLLAEPDVSKYEKPKGKKK